MDIRAGDSFHIIFEEKFVDGDYIGSGNILAAEFINQDDSFQAIRFTDSEYYTPDGKSMRKAFFYAPLLILNTSVLVLSVSVFTQYKSAGRLIEVLIMRLKQAHPLLLLVMVR